MGAGNVTIHGINITSGAAYIKAVQVKMGLVAPEIPSLQANLNHQLPYVVMALNHFVTELQHPGGPILVRSVQIDRISDNHARRRRAFAAALDFFHSGGLSFETASAFRPGVDDFRGYNVELTIYLLCGSSDLDTCNLELLSEQHTVAGVLSDSLLRDPYALLNLHNFLNDAYQYVYGSAVNIVVSSLWSRVVSTLQGVDDQDAALSGEFVLWTPTLTGQSGHSRSNHLEMELLATLIPLGVALVCIGFIIRYNYAKIYSYVTGRSLDGDVDVEMALVQRGSAELSALPSNPLLMEEEEEEEGGGERSPSGSESQPESVDGEACIDAEASAGAGAGAETEPFTDQPAGTDRQCSAALMVKDQGVHFTDDLKILPPFGREQIDL